MTKPALLMLLSRHPYAEQSGRGAMLRQRIEQVRLRFEPRIAAFASPVGDQTDFGIAFLPMASPPSVALNAARLSRLPRQTWLYYSSALRQRIAALAAECGAVAVYIDMLRLAPLVRDLPNQVAEIVDYDDLLSERYAQAAARDYDVMGFLAKRVGPLAALARGLSRPLLRSEAARCAAYEREVSNRADLVLFTSPLEAARMPRGRARVLAAPPLMATRENTPPPGRRLIFLGNMRYGENVLMLRALDDAAQALASQRAWPDDAIIEIVGDHAPDLPAAFAAGHLRFHGRAPDLAVLEGAGIFLAPVTSGSGVKLKVLDGMALGCPVVGTPKALDGLAARANRDLLIARDPTEVLRAAIELRDRGELKAMLVRRAHAYLKRRHAPEIGATVAEAMAAVASRVRQETL